MDNDKLIKDLSVTFMLNHLLQGMKMQALKAETPEDKKSDAIVKLFEDEARLFINQLGQMNWVIVPTEKASIPDAFKNMG